MARTTQQLKKIAETHRDAICTFEDNQYDEYIAEQCSKLDCHGDEMNFMAIANEMRANYERTPPMPKLIVIVPHSWGKGDSLTEAWKNVAKHAGTTVAKAKRGQHLVYFGHDTESVPIYVNEMGALCHHADYPATLIDQKEGKS